MTDSSSRLDKNTATVSPMEDTEEETSPAATRQQKIIKAGLLAVLAVIVVYVVLDYTVSIVITLSSATSSLATSHVIVNININTPEYT